MIPTPCLYSRYNPYVPHFQERLPMSSRWLCWTMMLGLMGGCSFAVQEQADRMVCELPNHPLDLEQLPPADQSTQKTDSPAKLLTGDGLKPAAFEDSQAQEKPR